MATIHSTALVDPKAELAADVTVGPYTIIGPHVRIGPGTAIGPHAVLEGWTTLGARCRVFAGAILGAVSQDLKFKGQQSSLTIGDDNTIREYATLNRSTHEGSTTRVGNSNLIMAYAHVAHDCVIGDRCVLANNGTLAGHVTLEDQVVIGGLAAVHQFVRVGRLAIVGGCSKVVQDVAPYAMCDGHPARIYGINIVGLRRAGVSASARRALQAAFHAFFNEGLTPAHAAAQVEARAAASPELQHLVAFVRGSKRGLCRGVRHDPATRLIARSDA